MPWIQIIAVTCGASPLALIAAGHVAVGPVEIPSRAIRAGCRPGGVVLDPFSGTATTGLAARRLGRRYIGVDLNPRFHDLAVAELAEPRRRWSS